MKNLAEKRGLLNVNQGERPRKDPPFAFRELITSQAIDTDIENIASEDTWENWVNDHGTSGLIKFRPDTEQNLLDAVIWSARYGQKVRAVGSGHSHSKVAAPDTSFVQLSWNKSKKNLSGLIDTSRPNQKWKIPGAGTTTGVNELFRAQGGATIKYLNRGPLKDAKLGLLNMGSFDGQTLAGAINTSTHGTGARLGSLADSVRSVELMAVMRSPVQSERPIVRKFRIEPESGGPTPAEPITVREDFEEDVGKHETTLIQDDDVFHSVVVGYGCMGIAYSYTFETRPRYFLDEDTRKLSWNEFKNDIDTLIGKPDPQKSFTEIIRSFPSGARHFQFRVNLARVEKPFPGKNWWYNVKSVTRDAKEKRRRTPECLLISHREAWKYSQRYDRWPGRPAWWGKNQGGWPRERGENSFQSYVRNKKRQILSGFHPYITNNFFPEGIASRFKSAAYKPTINGGTPNYTASYIALRRKREEEPHPEVDPEPPPPAISTEIAVPANQVKEAVEEVFEEVIDNDYAYNLPMGVRFVDWGDHFLSPEYGGGSSTADAVAKVEVPFLVRPYKHYEAGTLIDQEEMLTHGKKALKAIERRLLEMSRDDDKDLEFARPHMGKTNHVNDDGFESLSDMYERFETWQAVHEEFDGFGTFDNEFTEEMGISIDPEGEQ